MARIIYRLVILFFIVTVSVNAQAASVDLSPTADGDVQTFGGDDVNDSRTHIAFTQSGGLARNGILEFNLSSIADGAIITAARLDITLTRFVSNTGSNPSAIDIIAYNGDGIVDINDYAAAGTQVVDTTTPAGGVSSDVRSFTFDSLAPVTDALMGDLLTLRIETDSFASINFASLENASLNAANLHIEFTPVPLPAGLPLILSGLALLSGIRRKRNFNERI